MAKHHLTAKHKYRLLKSFLRTLTTLLVVVLTLLVKSDSVALSEKARLGDIAKNAKKCQATGSLKSMDNKG